MKRSDLIETQGVTEAVKLMAIAARTAPKTRGIDNIETIVIDDAAERSKVIEKMAEISKKENRPSFARDASSIQASPALFVFGVRSNPSGLNCGFCGYKTCDELKKTKGVCAYNSIDLGLAVMSAAGLANHLHVDNRIMYSIGRASLDLGFFSKDVKQALGIPLSVTGKNPYFDRK